ncbi:MAG: hypothetical protein COB76_05165 [Alphaproteobacteria bacterium]|nr:MAG: hypothetical protein COB76_05165 [Alphaproteobacteria bacterium]
MRDVQSDILNFWFSEIKPAQWFQKSVAFDADIIARFEPDYKMALQGIYDGWQGDEKGALALCILLDQFPRNMYRDTPQAFASDARALEIAKEAVSKGYDTLLSTQEKTFLYLPLEHSEVLEDQHQSVQLFAKLMDDDPIIYDYAKRHYDVIKKFGRFPHRNAIMDRKNTSLEEEYLSDPNNGF